MTTPWKPIIDSLKNEPEAWLADSYVLKHEKTGVEIWTARGFLFLGLYPGPSCASLFDKVMLWPAVRKAMRGRVARAGAQIAAARATGDA